MAAIKPITTIYCLKNPLDRNRVFYVGKTIRPLQVRLMGHISNTRSNTALLKAIAAIKGAGKKPIIEPLEVCEGHFLPCVRERYWIARMNRRKVKLTNSVFATISKKTVDLYVELSKKGR